jgi:hypothetical protein
MPDGSSFHRRSAIAVCLLLAFLAGSNATEACDDLARAETSRWATRNENEIWWLVTPCGERFLSLGVNVVDGGVNSRDRAGILRFRSPALAAGLDAWAASARRRLVAWGFNTAGAWSLSPQLLDLPTIPVEHLGRSVDFAWWDPFNPQAVDEIRQLAWNNLGAYRGNPLRIGYFADNEYGWWNAALFQVWSAAPPRTFTKRRLLAFLRERYQDGWSAFLADFVPPAGVRSFADLLLARRMTRLRPGGTGIATIRGWTSIVAEQYYQVTSRALHDADPEALFFGDRLPIFYDPDAVRMMARYVDAIPVNYNVDSGKGWIARYFFDGLRELSGGKPVLVSEWFFAARENRTGNRNPGHLMTVATQAERAAGAAAATRAFAGMAEIIGLHWFKYYDHPKGGRYDGEDYNFGLVDIDDRPYRDLTNALTAANRDFAVLHARAAEPAEISSEALPRAAIDTLDESLEDWPLETALRPMRSAPGEAPFADVYVAWSPGGLHLAVIGMDYFDPALLAHRGPYPLSEAFRVDLGIDAGAGARRIAAYVVPTVSSAHRLGFDVRLRSAKEDPGRAVPGAVARYFGVARDQPRILFEATLPWAALGVSRPPPRVHWALGVTTWYRARWMSSSGASPALLLADPSTWRAAELSGGAIPQIAAADDRR